MYKQDLAFNNPHELICHKTQPTNFTKKNIHPLVYQEKLLNIPEKYPNYSHIYTDSSKDSNRSVCRAVFNDKATKKYLPKEVSIFTKTCAIELTFNIVLISNSKRFIIHSDSFSVLLFIKNRKLEYPLIIKQIKLHEPY